MLPWSIMLVFNTDFQATSLNHLSRHIPKGNWIKLLPITLQQKLNMTQPKQQMDHCYQTLNLRLSYRIFHTLNL